MSTLKFIARVCFFALLSAFGVAVVFVMAELFFRAAALAKEYHGVP